MTVGAAIRSLLTALAGLLVGLLGALLVISVATRIDPADVFFRMAAGYLAWFLIALLTVHAIRRFMPGWRDRAPAAERSDGRVHLSRIRRDARNPPAEPQPRTGHDQRR